MVVFRGTTIPKWISFAMSTIAVVLLILLGRCTAPTANVVTQQTTPEPPLCQLMLVTPSELSGELKNASTLVNNAQVILLSSSTLQRHEVASVINEHLGRFLVTCIRTRTHNFSVVTPQEISNTLVNHRSHLTDSNLVVLSPELMNDDTRKIVTVFLEQYFAPTPATP